MLLFFLNLFFFTPGSKERGENREPVFTSIDLEKKTERTRGKGEKKEEAFSVNLIHPNYYFQNSSITRGRDGTKTRCVGNILLEKEKKRKGNT